MTDQTPPEQGGNAAAAAPQGAMSTDALANGTDAAEIAAPAPDPAADEAAKVAGFADAAAKAEFEAAAAAQKPKRQRAPRTAKAKDGGFSVKAPSPEQFEAFVGMAAAGGIAQFVLADGRKAIEGVRPATSALMLRRGRPANAAAIAYTGAAIERAVEVTHVFALDAEDKPTAQPLAIAELAAPVQLRPGEQFKIDAGGVAFFAPVAAS